MELHQTLSGNYEHVNSLHAISKLFPQIWWRYIEILESSGLNTIGVSQVAYFPQCTVKQCSVKKCTELCSTQFSTGQYCLKSNTAVAHLPEMMQQLLLLLPFKGWLQLAVLALAPTVDIFFTFFLSKRACFVVIVLFCVYNECLFKIFTPVSTPQTCHPHPPCWKCTYIYSITKNAPPWQQSIVTYVRYVTKMAAVECGKCPSIHTQFSGRLSAPMQCAQCTRFSHTAQCERTYVLKILSVSAEVRDLGHTSSHECQICFSVMQRLWFGYITRSKPVSQAQFPHFSLSHRFYKDGHIFLHLDFSLQHYTKQCKTSSLVSWSSLWNYLTTYPSLPKNCPKKTSTSTF